MEKKWIDLALLDYDRWALLVRPAIDQAVREGRTAEPSATFNELVGSLGLRLSLLPRIRRRIDEGWQSLSRSVLALEYESYVSTPDKDGYAYPCDRETFLDLVLDIESLLFELGSCIDLIEHLLTRAYRETKPLNPAPSGRPKLKAVTPGPKVGKRGRREYHHLAIRSILDQKGIEMIDTVFGLRDDFIHKAAPYPRVEITTRGLELVFLRENVAHSKERMTLLELCAIDRQFEKSKQQIQKHLIGIYEKCK